MATHPLVVEPASAPVVESVSASQAIANKVLGEGTVAPARWPFSSVAPASTALAADGKTGPIRVVLEECKRFSHWAIIIYLTMVSLRSARVHGVANCPIHWLDFTLWFR